MKKYAILGMLLLSMFYNSQNVSCRNAISQLQNYATQVNQMYYQEYNYNIPYRCPSHNAYMQPYNPYDVQNCRNNMAITLNYWYGQQSAYVNTWYNQIVYNCMMSDISNQSNPAPDPITNNARNSQINAGQIKDLVVGVDESKALKIVIPDTPQGYNP